jgi:protein translocase SecG subunit
MNVIILIIQIIVAVTLSVVIMLQNRGSDTGMAFSAGTGSYRSKKGLERVLFYATIVLAASFACISIIAVLI